MIDYVLGLRLHPHIANNINLNKYISKNIIKIEFMIFPYYNKLNTLLICCDILITDYSSIIYEYALTKKPMIFYPYDLDEFEKSGEDFMEIINQLFQGLSH